MGLLPSTRELLLNFTTDSFSPPHFNKDENTFLLLSSRQFIKQNKYHSQYRINCNFPPPVSSPFNRVIGFDMSFPQYLYFKAGVCHRYLNVIQMCLHLFSFEGKKQHAYYTRFLLLAQELQFAHFISFMIFNFRFFLKVNENILRGLLRRYLCKI